MCQHHSGLSAEPKKEQPEVGSKARALTLLGYGGKNMQTAYVCFQTNSEKKKVISSFFLFLLLLLFHFSFLPFSVPLPPPWVTIFASLTLGDIMIVNVLLFLCCGDVRLLLMTMFT